MSASRGHRRSTFRLSGPGRRARIESESAGNLRRPDRGDLDRPAEQLSPRFCSLHDCLGHLFRTPALLVGHALDHELKIAVEQYADPELGLKEEHARVVEKRGPQFERPRARVRDERLALVVETVHPGRVIDRDEHPLRAVLEIPAPFGVGRVVSADEIGERRIADALEAVRHGFDEPAAAPVEPQPAVHRRHVRPLQHRAQHDSVHRELWYARSLMHRRIDSGMKREDFTFVHTLRVRWAEVDRQDVVFNGHYFLYFDVAVAEYWRAIGFRYPEDIVEKFGTDIYAVKASAEYHGSATYDELIDIGCRVGRIGRSSMQLVFGIWRGAEHITSGELIYVNADPKTRKSAPWPEPIKRAILRFERTRPAEADA